MKSSRVSQKVSFTASPPQPRVLHFARVLPLEGRHDDAELDAAVIHFPSKPPYKFVLEYMMGATGEGSQGKVRGNPPTTLCCGNQEGQTAAAPQTSELEQARRELAIHERLKHPNVVELYRLLHT